MKSTNDQLCFDDYDIEIINKSDRDVLFDTISDLECGFIGFSESNMPYLKSPVDLILCVDTFWVAHVFIINLLVNFYLHSYYTSFFSNVNSRVLKFTKLSQFVFK